METADKCSKSTSYIPVSTPAHTSCSIPHYSDYNTPTHAHNYNYDDYASCYIPSFPLALRLHERLWYASSLLALCYQLFLAIYTHMWLLGVYVLPLAIAYPGMVNNAYTDACTMAEPLPPTALFTYCH
jgi:hypothetical protein